MKVFITGGGGFLGSAIVRELCQYGHEVVSFSRNQHPSLTGREVKHIRGEITDYESLKNAMSGCEAVFHVAAKTGIWGKYETFYAVNVKGTQNVIRACQEWMIPHLVYTSSPSVVFDGMDSEGKDESLPYAQKYTAAYPQTKAIAEKLVLEANNETLQTVSLRPHLIWGPGDPYYLPKLFEKAKAGRLFLLGKETRQVDCIYIENAASAHRKAWEQLLHHPEMVAGKVYFLSQGQPISVAELINRLLASGGYPPVARYLSPRVARVAGSIFEQVYRVFRISSEPPLTNFLAQQLSTAHWYDIAAARRDFGYQADISIDEGMRRLRDWVLNEGCDKNKL